MPQLPTSTAAGLTAVLDRAVTLDNGYLTDCLEDDLRMMRRLGVRFVGRSAHVWKPNLTDDDHFTRATTWATRVHAEVGPEVILQAAIFEAIFPAVGTIPVPAWVFTALGEPVEQRNFSFSAMFSDLRMAPGQAFVWQPDGEVPDLTMPEARRWVLYRAGRYLDAGFEALHLGQIHLMAARDVGLVETERLCSIIRRLATARARRGGVLLDAHSHGVVIDGMLLFDFVSRPLSCRPRLDASGREDLILQWKGGTPGGRHPGGWVAAQHPTLIEFDNWGGATWPKDRWDDRAGRVQDGRWGRDDVTWFAYQSDADRAVFLRYALHHALAAGSHVHLQMPLCRTLGNDPQRQRPQGGRYYRANHPSAACPDGWGDEDVIAALWSAPPPVLPDVAEPANRVGLPGPVLLLGDIQHELGGHPGDTQCPYSRLNPVAGAVCEKILTMPVPGTFTFVVAPGGTRMEPLGQGISPGGAPWTLTVREPGDRFFMRFDYQRRTFLITPLDS